MSNMNYRLLKPYPHQQKLIDENPNKALVAFEMRCGKSLVACHWIDHPCRQGNTYIITPKQNKKDWIDFGTNATVLTKEEFKKTEIVDPTAIVVDELHFFASPLFLKGRSQLATKLYTLLKEYPDCHFMGLSGTPIRQDAWSLHTLLCYKGVYYDWKKWRATFFELKKMPFLRFPAWFPKSDWRIKIRPYLEKHCDIVSLRDIVEYLPPLESIIIKVKQPPYKKPIDKVVTWIDEHLHEQQNKYKEILKLDYRKIIVVAHYTDQIDELRRQLEKDKPVYILDGRTKDPSQTIKEAQEADDCFLISQSSMGFGWDGWMFSAMVFASMSHSVLNHSQMLGRLRHTKHLRTLSTVYLQGGRWDRRIMETIDKGKEFNPAHYRHD
jgi:superfamily II DNA or RNA helicase